MEKVSKEQRRRFISSTHLSLNFLELQTPERLKYFESLVKNVKNDILRSKDDFINNIDDEEALKFISITNKAMKELAKLEDVFYETVANIEKLAEASVKENEKNLGVPF